jgi:Glutamyl-tRNA reductase
LNEPTVSLHLFSVTHSDQGLDAVARVARRTRGLGEALREVDHVEGALVLSTCNRVDVYADIRGHIDGIDGDRIDGGADGETVGRASTLLSASGVRPGHHEGREALTHLFSTACGLDSMVVGEREIIGQIRRAAETAKREGCLSGPLARVVEQASLVSRRVARETHLAGDGRSVVAVALGLAEESLPPLPTCRVVLVGTGSYAGAVVAALRDRGVREIGVHSASGRAARFAGSHGLSAVDDVAFSGAVAGADLVVCCRGNGEPALTREVAAPAVERGRLTVLDLAITCDVAREVADLPGVTRIDLAQVREAAPATSALEEELAWDIVRNGVEDFLREERARGLDPAIVALRMHISDAVEDEVVRMTNRHAGITSDHEAERALRHLAARLVHEPSRRAREAAAQGRSEQYLEALEMVFGIHPE